MARKRYHRSRTAFVSPIDSQVAFIIVLALAFLLVVFVAAVLQPVALKTRATLTCGPTPTIPGTKCSGKWTVEKNVDGCPYFQCTPAKKL